MRANRAIASIQAPRGPIAGRPVSTELRELAHDVARLTPDRRDPERYFVEKDRIARRLAAVAADMDGAP